MILAPPEKQEFAVALAYVEICPVSLKNIWVNVKKKKKKKLMLKSALFTWRIYESM